MSAPSSHCPLSLEDTEAGKEILKAPLGHCPKIDMETRMILRALLEDMFNHLHTWHDWERCEDAWLSAMFMHDILSDILKRTPENTKIPETLEWLKPINPEPQTAEKERTAMSFDDRLDTDDIDALLDPVFELDLDRLQIDVLTHMEGQLDKLLGMVRSRYGPHEEE